MSPESVFWRYKYFRRLYRLEYGFAQDSTYRKNNVATGRERSDREVAADGAFGMDNCYSRVRDHTNFTVRNGSTNYMPSPWTIPEIRAYQDFQKEEEDWLVQHADEETEAASRVQLDLRQEEISKVYTQIQADHEKRLRNRAYKALFLAEAKEDERDVERAINLRSQLLIAEARSAPNKRLREVEEDDEEVIASDGELEESTRPPVRRSTRKKTKN